MVRFLTLFENGNKIKRGNTELIKNILKYNYELSERQIQRIIYNVDKREINGLFLSYKDEYNNKVSQQQKRHNRQKRRKYNNTIYAFDIETSTYDVNKDRKLSILYLGCIKGIECKPNEININNFYDYINYNRFFRTFNELNDILNELNETSKEQNLYTYVYVHNLSYEFSFMQNLKLFIDNFNNDSLIASNMRKPISFELDHLIIRCSYKLINKSLAVIGDELGFKKLTDDKGGYLQQFTPVSDLPNIEYLYNERDVDITLLGILETFKNSNYYKSIDDIQRMITATSLTRLENQLLTDKENTEKYTKHCTALIKFYNQKFDNERIVYDLLKDTFTGGYVRANRNYLFMPQQNVLSYDIASSYPSQMFMAYYPIDFKIIENDKLNFLKDALKDNSEYINYIGGVPVWYIKKAKKTLPHYLIANVTLSNLRVKKFKNNNEMPLLSVSKCNSLVNEFISNGRVIKADALTTCLTGYDLIILKLFYDFKITNCYELLHTTKHAKLHDYVTNSLHYFAKQKVVFKRLLNCDKQYTINDFKFNDDLIVTKEFLIYFMSQNKENQKEILTRELKLAKSRLNAQYGVNVQQLLPPLLEFDTSNNEWTQTPKNKIDDFRLMRNYINGVHITAFSRMHLAIMSYLLFTLTNSTILYWDTDSIKIINDTERVKTTFNNFNESINKYWNCDKFYNMGLYDYEGKYNYFATGGAKSYIYDQNGKLTISISGVPKKNTSEYLNTIYDNNFNEFIHKYYHPNTVICADVTKKLATAYYKYNDNKYNVIVTDQNGVKYNFKGYGGCILLNSDFTITGTGWSDVTQIEEANTIYNLMSNGVSLIYTTIGTPTLINDMRFEYYNESDYI